MDLLEALPRIVRGGLVKAAKHCGAGLLGDAAALSYPSQRCLFGNKRADSGAQALDAWSQAGRSDEHFCNDGHYCAASAACTAVIRQSSKFIAQRAKLLLALRTEVRVQYPSALTPTCIANYAANPGIVALARVCGTNSPHSMLDASLAACDCARSQPRCYTGEGRRPKAVAGLGGAGKAAALAALEEEAGMELTADVGEAADFGAFLPPTPTDAVALTAG